MTRMSKAEFSRFLAIAETQLALEELGKLPVGWNGYGAEPINPAIIESATQFLNTLPDGIPFPLPQVVPMTKGRLQLEWNDSDDKRSLEIEFASPNHVCYLQVDDHEESEVQELVSLTEPWKLHELIRRFADKAKEGKS